MSQIEAERLFIGDILEADGESDEVANDAIQLLVISTFNGLCRVIAALARNGVLSPDQLANIEDAMTTPLDDPDWRDYSFITETRSSAEKVLARAVSDARPLWED